MKDKVSVSILVESGKESRKTSEVGIDKPLSVLFIAKLTSSTKEEIQKAANDAGVEFTLRNMPYKKGVRFYNVESLPEILFELKRVSGDNRPWLSELDLQSDNSKIRLPSGSILKISRE